MFVVNLPVAAVAVLVTWRYIHQPFDRDARRPRRLRRRRDPHRRRSSRCSSRSTKSTELGWGDARHRRRCSPVSASPWSPSSSSSAGPAQRARARRRDRHPRVRRRLRRAPVHRRGLLRRAALPAAVLPEAARRLAARGRPGAAAADGRRSRWCRSWRERLRAARRQADPVAGAASRCRRRSCCCRSSSDDAGVHRRRCPACSCSASASACSSRPSRPRPSPRSTSRAPASAARSSTCSRSPAARVGLGLTTAIFAAAANDRLLRDAAQLGLTAGRSSRCRTSRASSPAPTRRRPSSPNSRVMPAGSCSSPRTPSSTPCAWRSASTRGDQRGGRCRRDAVHRRPPSSARCRRSLTLAGPDDRRDVADSRTERN